MNEHRDNLGRLVREAWIKWSLTQDNPKPSWLVPYDELAECDKEADRQIGEALFEAGRYQEQNEQRILTDYYIFECSECGREACVTNTSQRHVAAHLLVQNEWNWTFKSGLICPTCVEEFADERGALLENQ